MTTKTRSLRERRLKAAATKHHNAKLGRKIYNIGGATPKRTEARMAKARKVTARKSRADRRVGGRGGLNFLSGLGKDIKRWLIAPRGALSKAKGKR